MITRFKISRVIIWMMAALVLGLAASAGAAWHQARKNTREAQAALDDTADDVFQGVGNAMALYQYGLRGARGAILTAGEFGISRQLFRAYSETRDIATEFPGATGFGFIHRVPETKINSFIADARRDAAPNFAVRQLSPHAGDRYLIEYFEPQPPNSQAVGLDIASEPTRKRAADLALATGQATLTGPVSFGQNTAQQSFLLLLPIYRTGATPENEVARDAAGFGWAFAPLTMTNVLAGVKMDKAALQLRLFDITDPASPIAFYTIGGGPKIPRVLTTVHEADMYGRRWRMEVSATPVFIGRLGQLQPLMVLAFGTATSLVLTAFVGVFSVSQQRKRLVAAERQRLATIVDNSSDPIIGETLEGTILSWNRAAEQMFGYREDEVLGRSLAELLIPPALHHEDAELLAWTRRGEAVGTFETLRLHRDGTPIDMSVTAGPMREPDGRIIGAAKLMRDIGARKREERRLGEIYAQLEWQVSERTAALNQANALLANVLHSASEVAIIATDTTGAITVFNAGAERMLGYAAAEMIGQRTLLALHLADEIAARGRQLTAERGRVVEDFRIFVEVPETAGAETREWTYVRKDKSHLRVSLVVTAMRDTSGRVTGYLGIAEDITERLRTMAALQEAKTAAEAASTAKSQFLAMMSHELRTPMTGVLGMADLLLASKLQEEQRTLVQTLMRSGRTLLNLLNDILDFAKIEAGRTESERIDFSVAKIVEDVGSVISPLASERGNQVHIDIDGLLPAYLGDAKQYRQVLMNLAGNANKFTTGGDITIRVTHSAPVDGRLPDGRFMVETSVTDTGIGIAAENRDRLFQPFVQEDVSTSRKFGGTGLGLAISKRLAELMGGTITVQSTLGKGSTFAFTALLAKGDAAKLEHDEPRRRDDHRSLPAAERPLTILVAEDNETNRMLLIAVLTRMGHSVTAVENGALAVAAAGKSAFDIILMDMQMPVMDGPDAVRHIRKARRRRVPIIALTADAVHENHHKYFEAGVEAIVTKPVDWPVLAREMERATSGALADANTSEEIAGPASGAPTGGLPLLDPAFVASLTSAIDRDGLLRLADSFADSITRYTADISDAQEKSDFILVSRTAHALKGIALQFGATRLGELASQVEQAVKSRQQTAPMISDVDAATRETLAAVEDWRKSLQAAE